MHSGKLILLMGPSGSGKGTLLSYAREHFPEIIFPTSWTTRTPRSGEEEGTAGSGPGWSGPGRSGKKYHFATEEEFAAQVERGDFLEWARYGGHSYGTPKQEINEALAIGKPVLQELEMQGVVQIMERLPREQIILVFVDAGSWEELKRRILSRGTMSEEDIEHRRVRYEEEKEFAKQADFVISNPAGKIVEAEAEFANIISTATHA